MAEVKKEEKEEKEETTSERAQRIARETVAKRKADAEKRQKDTLTKAAAISADFIKSAAAPMFLPFKDRDGKTVPALVIGSREDYKRTDNGELVLDEKTRETVPQFQLMVWVFSGASVPHQANYDFEANAPKK